MDMNNIIVRTADHYSRGVCHAIGFVDGNGTCHRLVDVYLDREESSTFTSISCIYGAENIDAVIACFVKASELITEFQTVKEP